MNGVILRDLADNKIYMGGCYRELSIKCNLSMSYLEKLARGQRKSDKYLVYWVGEKPTGDKAIQFRGISDGKNKQNRASKN